jgi:hypothetical protein
MPDDIDLSAFVPEAFKGEDGAYDTAGFRARFDELTAFRAQEDERIAALPTEASAYAWALPEGHSFPEGFDPAKMATKDDKGNEVAFDPAKMFDPEDPDVAAVQAALLEMKAPPGLMSKLAGVMINRELRGIMEAERVAGEQMAMLGDQVKAKARVDVVQRELSSRLPSAQAAAIMDGLTTAEAVRGMEQILKASSTPPAPAPGVKDMAKMSIDEKLDLGLQQRAQARGK